MDVITTNSYAIVPFHIGDERFDKDAQLLAERAGQLAKKCRKPYGRGKVAGSIPPLFLVRIALICLTKIKYKDLPHRLSIN
ncbi:homocysteine S-methyltransferase family protein [Moraxella bovoculi]|uniref:homocysteine S-methyltransferase family protein n=1 Tax=Moraxella bovoculi TaxID=386891 RepID=UPI0022262ADA|nr:homocysteine S-methyltransferase family protein [Moraxella bovoculi]